MKDTKPSVQRNQVIAWFLERIERIARQRDSGYPLELDEMTAIEFHGLLLWDQEHDSFQRMVLMAGKTFKLTGEGG